MASIVFYQDRRHDEPLYWIRDALNIGYISKRKDRITELRINGFRSIERILLELLPYIRFKRPQAQRLFGAMKILNRNKKLGQQDRIKLMRCILEIQNYNYQSPKKKTKAMLKKILGLTP
jgi:hypothetical protein